MSFKITRSQFEILGRLIFVESFETLLDETKMHSGALKDDLKLMMNHGLVKGTHFISGATNREVPTYNSDRLEEGSFSATSKGLKMMQTFRENPKK